MFIIGCFLNMSHFSTSRNQVMESYLNQWCIFGPHTPARYNKETKSRGILYTSNTTRKTKLRGLCQTGEETNKTGGLWIKVYKKLHLSERLERRRELKRENGSSSKDDSKSESSADNWVDRAIWCCKKQSKHQRDECSLQLWRVHERRPFYN